VSYELDFPLDVARQLLACTRKDIVPEVLEQLERLARNPLLATRVDSGALSGRSAYTMRVVRAPIAWRVTVFFQFSQDEERLVITNFGILRGDPPRLVPPNPC
jgi:hypothetical protein